jgi:hypothetical protein
MRVVRKETTHTFTRLPAGMAYRIASIALAALFSDASIALALFSDASIALAAFISNASIACAAFIFDASSQSELPTILESQRHSIIAKIYEGNGESTCENVPCGTLPRLLVRDKEHQFFRYAVPFCDLPAFHALRPLNENAPRPLFRQLFHPGQLHAILDTCSMQGSDRAAVITGGLRLRERVIRL